MIGGRVLDTSALVAFARGTSIYASAAVWTAVEESIVLIVPSTAIAAAWTQLAEEHHPVLEVLLQLPVTVVDTLDERRARIIGQLGAARPTHTRLLASKNAAGPCLPPTQPSTSRTDRPASTSNRCPDPVSIGHPARVRC